MCAGIVADETGQQFGIHQTPIAMRFQIIVIAVTMNCVLLLALCNFALEDEGKQIARPMRAFLRRTVKR